MYYLYSLLYYNRCPKGPGYVFGEGPSSDHCLEALMDNDKDGIISKCKFKLYDGGPMTLQVEQHTHFVHFDQQHLGFIHCEDGMKQYKNTRGNHVRPIISK